MPVRAWPDPCIYGSLAVAIYRPNTSAFGRFVGKRWTALWPRPLPPPRGFRFFCQTYPHQHLGPLPVSGKSRTIDNEQTSMLQEPAA